MSVRTLAALVLAASLGLGAQGPVLARITTATPGFRS